MITFSGTQTMQCTDETAMTTTVIGCELNSLGAAGVGGEAALVVVVVGGLVAPLEADTGRHPDAPSIGSLSQVSCVTRP